MNARLVALVVVLLTLTAAITSFTRQNNKPPRGNTVELAIDAAAREYLDTAKPAVFLVQGDSPVGANRPQSQLGGVPVRIGSEDWPVSRSTGDPMILLAQIVRGEVNADNMGNVELLRVFVDVRLVLDEIDESDAFELRITPVGSTVDFGNWPNDVLADVAALAERQIGYDPSAAPYILAAQPTRIGDDEVLYNAYLASSAKGFDSWSAAVDAAVADLQVASFKVESPRNRTNLGGYPYWVQGAKSHKHPFFLQLGPNGPLRIGDDAHIYIFLDRNKPQAGWQVLMQMG